MYAPINDIGFRVHRNLCTRMRNQAPQNQPYQDPPPLFTQGGARSANRGTICTARRTTKSIAPAAVPYTPVGSSPKPPDQSREPVRPASTRSASLRSVRISHPHPISLNGETCICSAGTTGWYRSMIRRSLSGGHKRSDSYYEFPCLTWKQ